MDNEKIYQMPFAKIYPLLLNKAVRKGHTAQEVNLVIGWLTGYTQQQILQAAETEISYAEFFSHAPELNPKCRLITGTVCGVRVETIPEPMMQEIRYLDKLIDELAKGRSMDKILRD